ncbi:MAG: hypothetical protein WAN17_08405 [Candidatus Sulfotelmatobacter sp.]
MSGTAWTKKLVGLARENPAAYVCCATVYAFVGGAGTVCLLFGRHFLRRYPFSLLLYAVVASFIGMFLFGYILTGALRRESSDLDIENPMKS